MFEMTYSDSLPCVACCSFLEPREGNNVTKVAYTITWSGVNLWSEALEWSCFWSGFFEWRFGVTLGDSKQENIWKSKYASPFRVNGCV